jgi:hypothetical protein
VIKKAILKSFNGTAYTATVQIVGSLSAWLQDVPVSRAIPSAEMISGRACALLLLDPSNPKDSVIVAVWTA